MMCLGKEWDIESRLYEQIDYNDNIVPPCISMDFIHVVYRAIHVAHYALQKNIKLKGVEQVLSYMDHNVGIVNFYNEIGKLGLLQDRDEEFQQKHDLKSFHALRTNHLKKRKNVMYLYI